MAEVQDLLTVDDNNVGRWPENMGFSAVNDAGRKDEGMLARWYKDTDASVVASGSSNAFAITSNRAITSMFNNLVMVFTANFSISGATTLNLNGLGAKSIKRYNGAALTTGDIIADQPIVVIYKASPDCWFMISAPAVVSSPAVSIAVSQYIDFTENASPGTPGANTARVYAKDDGAGVSSLAYMRDSGGEMLLRPATQAEAEAQTGSIIVTPAGQKWHPGHPKAWAQFNQTGTQALNASFGVSSITDVGTGGTRVTLATAMSAATYAILALCQGMISPRTWPSTNNSEGPTTTTFVASFSNNDSNFIDSAYASALVCGDQ